PAGVTSPERSELWLLESKEVSYRIVAGRAIREQQPNVKAVRQQTWLKFLCRKHLGLNGLLTKQTRCLLPFPGAQIVRTNEQLHAWERRTNGMQASQVYHSAGVVHINVPRRARRTAQAEIDTPIGHGFKNAAQALAATVVAPLARLAPAGGRFVIGSVWG